MKTREQKKLLLLQINDALFPIGGYSHSFGLETYIQKDLVKDEKTAYAYIRNYLLYNLCYTDLLTVKLAYEYSCEKRLPDIQKLEEIVEAAKVPAEIRTASKKLGARFIKTLQAMKAGNTDDIFSGYVRTLDKYSGHHAVAYGVFCAAREIEKTDMLTGYLYAQTSAVITNCVKSIPLSQTVGQKLLYQSHEVLGQVLKKLEELNEEWLFLSTPAFDIRCMQHECLYSRIYMS